MTEEMRRAMRTQSGNAFIVHNHIELVSVEQDKAVYRMEVRPESLNPLGVVHGGAFCAIADNAAGAAVHTDGRHYVTQSSTMSYLANQGQGTIYATGSVIRRGRATCLARAEITNEEGKLLAVGDFSFFCLDSRKD